MYILQFEQLVTGNIQSAAYKKIHQSSPQWIHFFSKHKRAKKCSFRLGVKNINLCKSLTTRIKKCGAVDSLFGLTLCILVSPRLIKYFQRYVKVKHIGTDLFCRYMYNVHSTLYTSRANTQTLDLSKATCCFNNMDFG